MDPTPDGRVTARFALLAALRPVAAAAARHGRTMARSMAVVLAVLAMPLPAAAQQAAEPATGIGCVRPELLACGCALEVKGLACLHQGPASGTHFFTGLDLDDPLHLRLGQMDLELAHAGHAGAAVKGDRAGQWSDEYSSDDVRVRISYAAGPSTCPSEKGEPCEYSDYAAEIVLQRTGGREQTFQAVARCGC